MENKKNTAMGCIVLIVILVAGSWILKATGCMKESSGSSSSSGSHTCIYCGNSYSHSGYLHIGSSCVTASNGWEKSDQCCSMTCCNDEWNSNH